MKLLKTTLLIFTSASIALILLVSLSNIYPNFSLFGYRININDPIIINKPESIGNAEVNMNDVKIKYIDGNTQETEIIFGTIKLPQITIESQGKKGIMDFSGSSFRYRCLGLSFKDAVKILFGGLTEERKS